jgi:hypothetical protein
MLRSERIVGCICTNLMAMVVAVVLFHVGEERHGFV